MCNNIKYLISLKDIDSNDYYDNEYVKITQKSGYGDLPIEKK